ncbi:MAG: chemotaxis protein CheR [Candidatus Marinimicrobia bacterium]|nr:chemotaxis protein CheR [Candidatus Neomarinimicrobiota bacterium]
MAFTYFFRDLHTINLIVKYLIPEIQGKRNIKLWDAGCAMGPEPFSLAICLSEEMGRFAFKNVHIDATDIDKSNLFADIIENGSYPYEQLQRIPKDIFDKYFERNGTPDHFVIDYNIRNRVRYTRHDLLTLKPVDTGYSLVMCKNVLLHFKPDERIQVIKMFHDTLLTGGLLAMEQTQSLPQEVIHLFDKIIDDGQIFRKK